MLRLQWLSLLFLCFSTPFAEANNIFVHSKPQTSSVHKSSKGPAESTEMIVDTPQTISPNKKQKLNGAANKPTRFKNNYNYWDPSTGHYPPEAPAKTAVAEKDEEESISEEAPEPANDKEDVASSEVKASPSNAEMTTSLRPKARPQREKTAEIKTASAPQTTTVTTETKESPTILDLSGCSYGKTCWKNKGLAQKVEKIISNVEHINKLHGAHLDPRYMLCTGWRESTFNPGARGADGEKGMFQIMNGTGRAALKYGPKVLPKDGYMDKMVNSTLAQTELSFLTLKMKVNEGASSRVLSGDGSIKDYWGLARRYNGAGRKAERYATKITSCLKCMRDTFPQLHGAVNESKVTKCLNKAKGN